MAIENALTKGIKLTEKQWATVHDRLAQEYRDRPSVLIIRSVMRRELGFTVRRHTEWWPNNNGKTYRPITVIVLDFYNAHSLTFFRLKYL
jgi:hypothetical protein